MSTNSNKSNVSISEKPDSLKETQFGGSHYKAMGIEPVQYIEANGINFTLGSAIKYITRHSVKNGAVDLKKAVHFIAMDLERIYGVKLTFSFSDEEQFPPDNSNELHGPGGEIDLREHGPGVDVAGDADVVATADKTETVLELVRKHHVNSWVHFNGKNFVIEKDYRSSIYNWISEECATAEEAWQSALNRIHQSQSGSPAANVSTPISTPTPLPSNSLQPHVAAHPSAAIRASESCCREANAKRDAGIQSY